MKIPQALHQFEKYPAIFLASGEYEAIFYLASKGEIKELERIKMAPREEAKEKQGMLKSSSDASHLGAVSHHGRYLEELKLKFAQKTRAIIHDLLVTYHPEEICLFAPKYVSNRILKTFKEAERKQVRMKFEGNYTKKNPLELLKAFQKEIDGIQEIFSLKKPAFAA